METQLKSLLEYVYYIHYVRGLSYQSYGSRKKMYTRTRMYTRERSLHRLVDMVFDERTRSGAALRVHKLVSSRQQLD